MSSPTGTPSKASSILTPRDVQLLGIAMQSMKDPNVPIDYEKFAELSGLTTGSARTIWSKLRRKLTASSGVEDTPSGEGSQSVKPKAKKGGRKRKAGDAADSADNSGADTIAEPQSPTAMADARRKKRVKTSTEDDVPAQDGEDEAGSASDEVQVKAEDGAVIKKEK